MEEILHGIGLGHLVNRIRYTTRLGHENSTNARPLKVEVASYEDREDIVVNAYKLKDVDAYKNKAFVSRDYIREDREVEHRRYEEKKARRAANRQTEETSNNDNRPGTNPRDQTHPQVVRGHFPR